MKKIMHVEDAEVDELVESIARKACEELDERFPGAEHGGITSGFQGSLVEVLKKMLTGRRAVRFERDQSLTGLVVTDDTFCKANVPECGTFLVFVRERGRPYCPDIEKCLEPKYMTPVPIENVKDSWVDRKAAIQQAIEYVNSLGEQAATSTILNDVSVEEVVQDPDTGRYSRKT